MKFAVGYAVLSILSISAASAQPGIGFSANLRVSTGDLHAAISQLADLQMKLREKYGSNTFGKETLTVSADLVSGGRLECENNKDIDSSDPAHAPEPRTELCTLSKPIAIAAGNLGLEINFRFTRKQLERMHEASEAPASNIEIESGRESTGKRVTVARCGEKNCVIPVKVSIPGA